MNQIELPVLQGVLSVVTLAVGVALSIITPRIKALVDRHVEAKQAQLVNHVIDGLTAITEGVVNEFNQKVVNDAKLYGLFTPALKNAVRADAIAAVKAQAGPLLALGKSVIGDADALIGSLVEKAVVKFKTTSQAQSETNTPEAQQPDQSVTTTPATQQPAPSQPAQAQQPAPSQPAQGQQPTV